MIKTISVSSLFYFILFFSNAQDTPPEVEGFYDDPSVETFPKRFKFIRLFQIMLMCIELS